VLAKVELRGIARFNTDIIAGRQLQFQACLISESA
jgi:hypothetical protein